MKKQLLLVAAVLFTLLVQAQQEIKIEDLSKHVGDSVTVCTKIYGGIFLDRIKDSLTLLNAGANYPNAPLTIVIRADARIKFNAAPEIFYKDKNICVSGKVTLYKDKPQLVIYDEKQIVVQ